MLKPLKNCAQQIYLLFISAKITTLTTQYQYNKRLNFKQHTEPIAIFNDNDYHTPNLFGSIK
jgi:hypothetical protein